MHLMYYTNEKGERVYTLKVCGTPQRAACAPARAHAWAMHAHGLRVCCSLRLCRRRRLRASPRCPRTPRASRLTTSSPSTASSAKSASDSCRCSSRRSRCNRDVHFTGLSGEHECSACAVAWRASFRLCRATKKKSWYKIHLRHVHRLALVRGVSRADLGPRWRPGRPRGATARPSMPAPLPARAIARAGALPAALIVRGEGAVASPLT